MGRGEFAAVSPLLRPLAADLGGTGASPQEAAVGADAERFLATFCTNPTPGRRAGDVVHL